MGNTRVKHAFTGARLRARLGRGQSDAAGHGVLARRRLSAGETIVDPTVFFVQRPPDYALAHLPQFHALEFGRDSYFCLREPALGLASLLCAILTHPPWRNAVCVWLATSGRTKIGDRKGALDAAMLIWVDIESSTARTEPESGIQA